MARGPVHRGAAAIAVLFGTLIIAAPVQAQAYASLPSTGLADALNAWSQATGIGILADPALLNGKKSPAIRRALTPEAALAELLQGSGLTYEKRGETILIVRGQRVPGRSLANPAKRPREESSVAFQPGHVAMNTSDAQGGSATTTGVIVTGTRIARPELESAMPISVIRMEDARNDDRNTAYDALLLNPAIGPGLGDFNSQGQEYDTGVANINLRNMGNNRSLVLVDGQRWVSSGARTSAVDLNTIPSAMIDHFEVVTGGAAAIYGADAVTGAVNIIMKKSITGLHISATTGISEQGDASQSNVSAVTGLKLGSGRGQFVIGGDYTSTAALRWADRYDRRQTYYPNPASKGPNDGIPDNILAYDYGSLYRAPVPSFYVNNQWYQYRNGAVVPASFNAIVTPGETGTGDGGPVVTGFENHLLRNASRRASLYSHLSYDLTPTITWSATFDYAHSFTRAVPEWPEVRTDARPANWWGGTTGEIATLTNPYLPDAIRQFMVTHNLNALPLDRSYFNLPQAYEIHHRDNVTIGNDVHGKLTRDLNWSAFARYGQVIDHIATSNMVGKNEWLNARDTIEDPATGQIECADAAARASGCQPLNFFSTDHYSAALLNYLEHTRYEWNKNALSNAGANIAGRLLHLPYGDVSVVAGFEWRRETLHTRDDPNAAKLADIVFSPGEDYAAHPALNAARDATELYGEAVIPVLNWLPLARRLEIEGAYRFSDYSDNPTTDTWKAGGTWEPVPGLTLRGVYSHSIRVPNFGELYVPISQVTYGHISDPCSGSDITLGPYRLANCRALLPGLSLPLPSPNLNAPVVYSGGNPSLTPETSNSYTLGLVLQPKLLRGFDMTIDYWDIHISNVITSLSYNMIMNSCVDFAHGPNQIYCQLVRRNANGTVSAIQAQYANLAAEHARGIDIGATYRAPLGRGLFRLGFSGTYLLEQTTIAQVGQPGIDYAGQWDYPRFKATLIASYSIGRITFGMNSRFTSRSLYSATAASLEAYEYPYVPSYVCTDMTVLIHPSEKYNLTFGIKNIANAGIFAPLQDTAAGPHGSGGAQTGAAYYDPVGRYFFLKIDINI